MRINFYLCKKRVFQLKLKEKICQRFGLILIEIKVGKFDFDSKWKHSFTAHPKIDPETGELIFFGYQIHPYHPTFSYGVADKKGNLIHQHVFDLPYPTLMHDCAVTKNYTIMMIHEMEMDFESMITGSPNKIKKEPKPSYYYIFPRFCKDPKEIIEFKMDHHFIFHTCNAYEEGDEIVMTACTYSTEIPSISFALEPSPVSSNNNKSQIHEYRFNLKTKEVKEIKYHQDESVEFPVIHPSYLTKKNQYSYYMESESGIVKFNHETKKILKFKLDENFSMGEAIFAPKTNWKDEDDGYLMTFVYDEKNETSTFQILDAKDLTLTCTIDLPRRIPFGFHGTWIENK
jgi:carotenoid cleavage dioxygenase-like enzyme